SSTLLASYKGGGPSLGHLVRANNLLRVGLVWLGLSCDALHLDLARLGLLDLGHGDHEQFVAIQRLYPDAPTDVPSFSEVPTQSAGWPFISGAKSRTCVSSMMSW